MKSIRIILICLLLGEAAIAQNRPLAERNAHFVEWVPLTKTTSPEGNLMDWFICKECITAKQNQRVPYVPVNIAKMKVTSARLANAVWLPLQFWEMPGVDTSAVLSAASILWEPIEIQRKMHSQVAVLAIRKANGFWEKLSQFSLEIQSTPITAKENNILATTISQGSVFQSGTWLKIGVDKASVYQLTAADLSAKGLNLTGKPSAGIRMYGSGGKMLSEANRNYGFEDIPEIAIAVEDGGDGRFDAEDKVLFYGDEPGTWTLNNTTGTYQYTKNIYSDTSFYFITYGDIAGKRIENQQSIANPQVVVSNFPDRWVYSPDNVNVLSAGREWYADVLDFNPTKTVSFPVANLDCDKELKYRIWVMARSNVAYPFTVSVNGNQIGSSITPPTVSLQAVYGNYGSDTQRNFSNMLPCNTSAIDVTINYAKGGNQQSIGYLNFIEVNGFRKLVWGGSNFGFRSFDNIGKAVGYSFTGLPADARFWEVTQGRNPRHIVPNGNQITSLQDTAQEFFAFSMNGLPKPAIITAMNNQNLQGIVVPDMVIVTNKSFLNQANRLADFRRLNDTLKVEVVTVDQVFNEFSSGSQDPTAIRNLAMHLFYKDPAKKLRYLLLFGDCSFDYKDRVTGNTNLVPTYEGTPSLNLVSSYSSDDYFGILSRTKGGWESNDLMDIGVGRLPAKNPDEAKVLIDKLIFYASDPKTLGTWRTRFTFVADDGDNCTHMDQAEDLTKDAQAYFPGAKINKLFLGAYEQVQNPGGFTSPSCTNDLITSIENGSLIVNYTGHGGETVWADEFLFTTDMINGLRNKDRLSFFVTATCDFGRHDFPAQQSGAESLLLNSLGGGIGIVTTGRPVNANSNKLMNDAFYSSLLQRRLGITGRFGDVMLSSKNINSDKLSNRGFSLLGDPSCKFVLPKEDIELVGFDGDSIRGLEVIELNGVVKNNGTTDTDFNGKIFATVLDKASALPINDNESPRCIKSYPYYKNVLYNGSAQVTNGAFKMKFVVSKDVSYQIGLGKIDLYAMDEARFTDADGYKLNIPVGGINPDPIADDKGPEITLYMNDISFVNYGLTGTDADLVAYFTDSSGINTSGLGLGHDITATLDGGETFVLNSYYESDEGTYKSGKLRFPFRSLSAGLHSITVKAWDNNNNSGTATIWFEVGIASANGKVAKEVKFFPNPSFDNFYLTMENAFAGEKVHIGLVVYDLLGHIIAEKNWEYNNSIARLGAFKELAWDGKRGGVRLPAGTYFCKISLKSDTETAEYKINQKIILLD